MVDITEISAIVAAAGVLVGVAYYILDMRNQTRLRQTDLVMRTFSPIFSMSYREWREYVLNLHLGTLDFKDYEDFVKKYGALMSGKPEPEGMTMILSYFEILGILVKRKLLSINIVYDFYGMYNAYYEVLMPIIEGVRKQYNIREFLKNCEYLLNELKKREQQLQQRSG